MVAVPLISGITHAVEKPAIQAGIFYMDEPERGERAKHRPQNRYWRFSKEKTGKYTEFRHISS